MDWRGGAWIAARLLCAAAFWPVCIAQAQTANPESSTELDPSAPLDALPGLGVDWPELGPESPVANERPLVAPTESASGAAADAAATLTYRLTVNGLAEVDDAQALLEAFQAQSALHKGRKDGANAAQLDRRARGDSELLAELLHSRGYYAAVVEHRAERQENRDFDLVLDATPGPRYVFRSVELPGIEAAGGEALKLRKAFKVQQGDPVVAQEVIDAGLALKVALGEQGFALAALGEQDIELDHQTHSATLRLPVDPGPLASFGSIRVAGRPPFSAGHLGRIARFRPGDPFKRSKVDDLRRALVATGLVSSAEVQVVPSGDRRTVDLAVQLEPAPMRTVSGELGYGTGEGLRAEASWQHRNLFNPEGALTLRGVAGTQEQVAAITFRRNNFVRRDQVLNLQLSASHIDRDAYKANTLLLGGAIERQSNIIWHKKWTWSIGADLIATDERGVFETVANKEDRTFLIAALPASLGFDASDDLLDPTRGFRLSARVSPELSARKGSFAYGRTQVDASLYQPLSSSLVAAGRVRVGTIIGASSLLIAPSRRLYSGGGGSVRGYGYQRLGPRDLDGDPIGGRGLAEFSLEGRVRLKAFGGNFGIVPFLDGGTLTRSALPDLSGWQLGAGVGVRYYSSFGPIRVDVGTPLNPRPGDSRVAVTVSLGQAF